MIFVYTCNVIIIMLNRFIYLRVTYLHVLYNYSRKSQES